MIRLLLAAALSLVPSTALAVTNTVIWTQDVDTSATTTAIERAPASGNRCGTFSQIATVPFGTLQYVDNSAPNGFICYRARNIAVVDPGDGSPTLTLFSVYSNIDSSKPGNPKNLQAQ